MEPLIKNKTELKINHYYKIVEHEEDRISRHVRGRIKVLQGRLIKKRDEDDEVYLLFDDVQYTAHPRIYEGSNSIDINQVFAGEAPLPTVLQRGKLLTNVAFPMRPTKTQIRKLPFTPLRRYERPAMVTPDQDFEEAQPPPTVQTPRTRSINTPQSRRQPRTPMTPYGGRKSRRRLK